MSYKIIAQALMEPGLKITNTGWKKNHPNAYIYFDQASELWIDEHNTTYSIDYDEFKKTWEIYQEKPKLKEVKFYAYVEFINENKISWHTNDELPRTKLFDSEGNHVSKTYWIKE